MKKKLIIGVFLILCLAGLKFYHHNNIAKHVISKIYEPAPITAVFDLEIEKPLRLVLFYTTESNEKFSYKRSVKKRITSENKHVEITLPAEKIYKFLLAFRSNPGKIKLKNVEIKADQYIDFNDWYSYSYKNIEKTKVNKEDNSLTLISNHQNPYMYWREPFVLYKKEK